MHPFAKSVLTLSPFALLALAACDRADGPGSASVTGVLRLPGGGPAAGATVRIYPVDHVPGDAAAKASAEGVAFSTRTDAQGRYTVDSLPAGEYNILGQKGDLQSYQDSVYLSATPKDLDPDTLLTAGTLAGRVALQPNHNPETVTVQALGTNAYANADAEGRFVLGPLAEGRYRLRVATTEGGYTPLFAAASVRAGRADSLDAILKPSFTGIPVVAGLTAEYDTLNGMVTLRWNKAHYPQLQEYEVLRGSASLLSVGNPIGRTSDTVYRDQVYANDALLGSGSVFVAGADGPILYYRVRVINQSEQAGLTYGRVQVAAVPPGAVVPGIGLSVEYKSTGKALPRPGLASPNDTLRVNASFSDAGRRIRRLRWYQAGQARPLREDTLEPPVHEGRASVFHVTGAPGREGYRVEIDDDGGRTWSESLAWDVVDDVPSLKMGPDTLVPRGGKVRLHATGSDGFGSIAKWEWDIGGTGAFRAASGPDTAFDAPAGFGVVTCVLRATDDDGYAKTDSARVTVGIEWGKVPAGFHDGFGGSLESPAVAEFQGKLWALGGLTEGEPRAAGPSHAMVSEDGVDWKPAALHNPFARRLGARALAYRDKLWVFGGQAVDGTPDLQDVWNSDNGTDWVKVSSNALPGFLGFDMVVFQDKMWCLGGGSRGNQPVGAWYSEDGANWTQAVSDEPFPQLEGHAAVVHDGTIFLIGGDEPKTGKMSRAIWSSTDGSHWREAAADPPFGIGTSIHALDYAGRIWLFGGDHVRYLGPDSYSESPVQGFWFSEDGIDWSRHGDPAQPERFKWDNHDPDYWPFAPYGSAALVFQGRMWSLFGRDPYRYWPSVWSGR